MHDEPVESERFRAVEFVAERLRSNASRSDRFGGREVDQVTIVRDHRSDAGLPHATLEERDFLGRQFARAPLSGRLRENLQCRAAAGFGAVDGARQSAGNREMGAQSRHR